MSVHVIEEKHTAHITHYDEKVNSFSLKSIWIVVERLARHGCKDEGTPEISTGLQECRVKDRKRQQLSRAEIG